MHKLTSSIRRRFPAGIAAGISQALCAAAFAAMLCLAACGESAYGDREPATIDNIRVDSVRILPFGSRYVIADAPTRLLFIRFNTGYTCSEILRMELASLPSGSPAAFLPDTRIRLPAVPDCALDSAGRDTTVNHVFGADLDSVRVGNSSGKVTDAAKVVVGSLGLDSLIGVLDSMSIISKGPWTFQDSSSQSARMLFGDSPVSCRIFNQASYSRIKDSVWIRFSYVTLDPSAAPDTCHGGAYTDTVTPAAYRKE